MGFGKTALGVAPQILFLSAQLGPAFGSQSTTYATDCLAYLSREDYEGDDCLKEAAAHQPVAELSCDYGCMRRESFAASVYCYTSAWRKAV